MEGHLFDYIGLNEIAGPVVGKVTGLILPENPDNPAGVTLYQVECYPQRPGLSGVVDMPPMAFAGMQTGGAFDVEMTIPVGTYVLVNFIEGDSGKPYIDRTWFSVDEETAVKASSGEIPRIDMRINGAKLLVNSSGDLFVGIRSGGKLEIQNANGDVVASFYDNGNVYVGIPASTKFLVTSDFITGLKDAFDAVVIAPGDGGAAIKVAISAALNTTLGTKKTSKLRAE